MIRNDILETFLLKLQKEIGDLSAAGTPLRRHCGKMKIPKEERLAPVPRIC